MGTLWYQGKKYRTVYLISSRIQTQILGFLILSMSYMRQEIVDCPCKRWYLCVQGNSNIWEFLTTSACKSVCKSVCTSASLLLTYMYHILKGIKYISCTKWLTFLDCVLIRGFKMWSKLPIYHDRKGLSSWRSWLSRNDHILSSNCKIHIKTNVFMTKSRYPDVCRSPCLKHWQWSGTVYFQQL